MSPTLTPDQKGVKVQIVDVFALELATGYSKDPEGDAQKLHQALLLLKRSRCINISAFCREAIAEKLERLEAVK